MDPSVYHDIVKQGILNHLNFNNPSVKLEFDIDIKDEELAAFAVECDLGSVILDNEIGNISNFPATKDVFCDNDTSLLGDNPYMLNTKVSPISKSKRKLSQPQRLNQANTLPLATLPTNPVISTPDAIEEDDVSESEYMEIHQELEQELESGDEDFSQFVPNSSPDTVEYASQFSINNNFQKGDEELVGPTETKIDIVCHEIKKELVEPISEESAKSVEEEWKEYWGIKCNLCTKVYKVKNEFDLHYLNRHAASPVYTCSYCDKNMSTYSNFRSHCYRHIAEGRHKCPICSKAFALRNILQMHILSNHTNEKPFGCDECDKGFATKPSLLLHKRKHKVNDKGIFPCTICTKILHTKGGLTSHMNVHRLGRRFMCDICGKTFTQKVNLQQHLKQHSGERPHKCNICDKSFAEKSHLSRHKSFHTEKRPFTCDICLKSYKTERCLRVHSKVHQRIRSHKCTTCDKTFMSSTKLKQHTNIHTGERPYKCKYCERTFTNYPNWLKHTRRQHKVNHKTGALLTPEEQVTKSKKKTPASSQPISKEEIQPQQILQENSSQINNLGETNSDFIQTDFINIINNSFTQNNEILNLTAEPNELTDQMALSTAVPAMQFIADDSRLSLQSQFVGSTFQNIVLPYQQSFNATTSDYQSPFYVQAGLNEEPIPPHIQQLLFSPANVHYLIQNQLKTEM